MRVCRPRRTRGRKSHFAKTRTEKNSSRMDKCVGRGCRTTRRIRWDKRNSRRVGSGKEGSRERMGSSFGIFVRFTKRSIVRVFAHENRKSSAKTTARFRKARNEHDDSPCHRSSREFSVGSTAEIGASGKTSDRHLKKKEESSALVSRLTRCLAWSQRPPATRAPRRASRPSRRAPRADSSLRGERVSMSAALGASAARRVPTECPPPTTTWSARAIPSFDGVAGSRAASTTVDARSRRCPSRVTHRVLLVASALASSPRLARTSRAPRVPRRAHAHR